MGPPQVPRSEQEAAGWRLEASWQVWWSSDWAHLERCHTPDTRLLAQVLEDSRYERWGLAESAFPWYSWLLVLVPLSVCVTVCVCVCVWQQGCYQGKSAGGVTHGTADHTGAVKDETTSGKFSNSTKLRTETWDFAHACFLYRSKGSFGPLQVISVTSPVERLLNS